MRGWQGGALSRGAFCICSPVQARAMPYYQQAFGKGYQTGSAWPEGAAAMQLLCRGWRLNAGCRAAGCISLFHVSSGFRSQEQCGGAMLDSNAWEQGSGARLAACCAQVVQSRFVPRDGRPREWCCMQKLHRGGEVTDRGRPGSKHQCDRQSVRSL